MTQVSIKVDAGTGSPVDFSQTGNSNYRQVVALGDSTTDANYATVDSSGNLHVLNTGGTITAISNLNAGTITTVQTISNLNAGTIVVSGTPNVNISQVNGTTVTTSSGSGHTGMDINIAHITAANTEPLGVVGTIASGSSDTGNPVKTGYYAITALPTAVSNGQRVNAVGDKFGRNINVINAPRELVSSSYTSIATMAENTLIAAQGSGIFADITSLIIANAGSTAVTVDIRDVTAGTIINSFSVPAMETRGGVFSVPWPQTTANSSWTVQLSTTVTAKIAAEYIKNK